MFRNVSSIKADILLETFSIDKRSLRIFLLERKVVSVRLNPGHVTMPLTSVKTTDAIVEDAEKHPPTVFTADAGYVHVVAAKAVTLTTYTHTTVSTTTLVTGTVVLPQTNKCAGYTLS